MNKLDINRINKAETICIDDFINRKHFADIYINTKPDFIDTNKFLHVIRRKNKKNCKYRSNLRANFN